MDEEAVKKIIRDYIREQISVTVGVTCDGDKVSVCVDVWEGEELIKTSESSDYVYLQR